jgi:hypothetical protein
MEEAVEQGEFVAEEDGIHGMKDSAPRISSLYIGCVLQSPLTIFVLL